MSPKDFGQAKLIDHWLIKQKDNKHNDVAAENNIKKFLGEILNLISYPTLIQGLGVVSMFLLFGSDQSTISLL